MKTLLFFIFKLFFIYIQCYSQNNINLSNWPLFDGEQYLAVNPINQNNIVIAWMQMKVNLKIGMAVKSSMDGGVTWSQTSVLTSLYSNYTAADPSIAFTRNGIVYLCYVDYAGEGTTDSGVVVIRKSTDGGLSWVSSVIVRNINESPDLAVDRPWIAVDNSNGLYDGYLYVTSFPTKWAPTGNQYLHLKYSSDGGNNWSGDIHVSAAGFPGAHGSSGMMNISKNGVLYITFVSLNGLTPSLALARTSNNGITFNRTHILNWYGTGDTLYQNSYNISSDPLNGQNLNICFVNKINSDPDIFSIKSTNGGVNWGSPVRVNKDSVNNGIGQDMSWSVWKYGKLGVVYRDRRNFIPGSSSNFDVYFSLSSDGGQTFYREEKINQNSSQFNQYGYRGNDFLGFDLSQTDVNVCWAGFVSGINWDIFYGKSILNKVNQYSTEVPPKYKIYQNYPNPFNPATKIKFGLPKSGFMELKVFDITGREVGILVNENLNLGSYEVEFDGSILPSGMYFYELRTNEYVETKKMILVK